MANKLPHIERPSLVRLARYGSVSAISTATSLSVLGLLVGVAGFSATSANLIAVAIGTIPSFALNRRWVWSCTAPTSLSRQVLPYCLLSLSGLVLSTVSVHLASDATTSLGGLVHTAAVELANLGTYGVLWLVQFALCDRVLFKEPTTSTAGPSLDETARAR